MQARHPALPAPNIATALLLALLAFLVPLVLAPMAWWFAAGQRRAIAGGRIRDTARGWLLLAEVVGCTITHLVVIAIGLVLELLVCGLLG